MGGIVGAQNRFARDFGNPDAELTGTITAIYDIGCVVGSIIAFFAGEQLGRRKMIVLWVSCVRYTNRY
jgi:MFS family permease